MACSSDELRAILLCSPVYYVLYLYECQTDNFDVLLKYYINVSLDTTYKQLAIEWGWERKAVISFLRSLQKMGVVEVKRKYRIFYIHILNLACIETEETENDSG